MKLYYYGDLTDMRWQGWFKNPHDLRKQFPLAHNNAFVVRFAHVGIEPPKGYHKPNGHLASNAIERIPTMKDLINAL